MLTELLRNMVYAGPPRALPNPAPPGGAERSDGSVIQQLRQLEARQRPVEIAFLRDVFHEWHSEEAGDMSGPD